MVLSNYFYLILIIYGHLIALLQVFKTNNFKVTSNYIYLNIVICLQTVL